MLDYREWCRLCGNLDGQIDPDANCLELIQLTYQISTLETTRICIDCFTILKNTLDMIKKAKELERLFEGLLQENDSDLTIKRLNAYRAHFQLQSMISEDIFKEEVQNDQKEEEEVYESLRYIELDVDQDDHNDTEYVDSNLVQQDQTILKLEELSQDVEIITEMEQSEVSLITQDEDYDIEGESYDEQFVEVVVSVQTSDNNSIVKTDVEKMFTFQCHLCSHEEFTNMKLLSRHCREVHNALPMVKCCSDECESVLSTWRRLMIHKDKHFPHDDQIKCNECQKVYLSAARLERHMLSHKVRFYCDQCGREFKEAKVLRTHELTHTVPLEERRNLFCTHDGCDKRFSSKQALQNHIAMRHDQQVTNHCKVPGCGRSFFARKAYNSHMRGVHGERKFACDECNFKATTKSALSNHSVSHKVGEKRFKCDMCNASFLILRRLRNHMIVHSDITPFLCQECPASFRRLKDLRSHSTTHTKQRPHVCQFCLKKFSNQPNCRKHKLKEHPEELQAWEKVNGVGGRKNFECYR